MVRLRAEVHAQSFICSGDATQQKKRYNTRGQKKQQKSLRINTLPQDDLLESSSFQQVHVVKL